MKHPFFYSLYLTLTISCTTSLTYDISEKPVVPVLNAVWDACEQEHIVYLCGSGPYAVTGLGKDAQVYCYVNDILVAEADSTWQEPVQDKGFTLQAYRIRARLSTGDQVCLSVHLPDRDLFAKATVPPPPSIRVDSVSVAGRDSSPAFFSYREYGFTLTLTDSPGQDNYYRLFTPSVHSEAWMSKSCRKVEDRDWMYGLPIDTGDPVFQNSPTQFPKEISEELPFLSSRVDNFTHVFTDALFQGEKYSFPFSMDQERFKTYSYANQVKYLVHFRLGALNRETYQYMLASNAAATAKLDPLSEPIIMPENVEGGIGFFALQHSITQDILLEDARYSDEFVYDDFL